MRRPTVLARSHRFLPTARPVTRGAIIARPLILRSNLPSELKPNPPLPASPRSPVVRPPSVPVGFQLDPYLDYGRFLTAEGGIRMFYKDVDERFRHTLWRLLVWTVFTAAEGTFLYERSPLQSPWITIACFIAAAILNWLVVRRPVEIYRSLEIRPDAMIIEGQEIFWRQFMENGPSFRPDKDGTQVLSGIYGTRWIDFLTVRRFDEFDRTPEIFAAHLQDAMKQLWTGLH